MNFVRQRTGLTKIHYPSDMIAGFAAGGAWLTGCILVIQAIRNRKIRRES